MSDQPRRSDWPEGRPAAGSADLRTGEWPPGTEDEVDPLENLESMAFKKYGNPIYHRTALRRQRRPGP